MTDPAAAGTGSGGSGGSDGSDESDSAARVARAALHGILLYCLAVLLLSVMDTLIKLLTETFPIGQIAFFRAFFAFLPLGLFVLYAGGRGQLVTRSPGLIILRGLLILGAFWLFVAAFRAMPLADAYVVGFTSPLFMTILSIPVLGEAVGIRRWSAVLVGFLGIVVMLRPGAEGLDSFISVGALSALGGAFLFALAATLTRRMPKETTSAILIYTMATFMIGAACTLPFGFVAMTAVDWGMMALVGIVGGAGAICLTLGLRMAQMAVIAPFEYTAMLWGVLFGYWGWGDVPDAWTWAGFAIVASSGLYILYRETVRAGHWPVRFRARPRV